MAKLSQYELEREANIARNNELLQQLELKQAVESIGVPKTKGKAVAKPVQLSKREKRKRDPEIEPPRRQSARLKKESIDSNESPSKRRKREREQEKQRVLDEEEQLKKEELARIAQRPRHNKLDLIALVEHGPEELSSLSKAMGSIFKSTELRVGKFDDFVHDDKKEDEKALGDLRERMQKLQVHSRAKVTKSRIYSAAYHPEITKDLIFFGDKEGQLGIWDARAAPDEVADEGGEVTTNDDAEGGKYWRVQLHWPATAKSSISSIKIDPTDPHNVYTGSYDGTVRCLSFTTGISREVYASDNLVCCVDVSPSGNEMWLSDGGGWTTQLDLRESKSKARSYAFSDHKIGSISINPTRPHFLLTASNSRLMRVWDVRNLKNIINDFEDSALPTPTSSSNGSKDLLTPDSVHFNSAVFSEFLQSKKGHGCLRGELTHDKSATAAFWDPRGRQIVSTSYDDTLRLWDIDAKGLDSLDAFSSFKPFSRVKHNCQTGKWVTLLKAQWTRNPDIYPYFTIGNMNHSLDIYSCKGDLIASLSDPRRITAVQAVTCSHPSIVERAVSGNASGRCVLWAPEGV